MHVIKGFSAAPEAAAKLHKRRMLRRVAKTAGEAWAGNRCIPVEQLASVDRRLSLAYQPRLSSAAVLMPDRVRSGPFDIGIDPFEHAVLDAADGHLTVAALATFVSAGAADDFEDDPIERTLALLALLGLYDMLAT